MTVLKTPNSLKRTERGLTPAELEDKAFIELHNATDEFVKEFRILAATDSTRSLIERALRPTANQMFVIMKIGQEDLDSAYEGVIAPLGEEFGYQVIRIDKIRDSGDINQQILNNIAQSRLILADLSGERPNCYYEAGFAHALGKEMIFAAQKRYKVHFDLAAYRFILWTTEADYRRELKERLASIKLKDSD